MPAFEATRSPPSRRRRELASIVLWSVIPAAFIGPGTVTSCISAGKDHGAVLLWTITFSAIACVLMQDAAARVAACSGRELAAALREQHRPGWRRRSVTWLIALAIGVGCAAYQAGNVLGATAGLALLVDVRSEWLVLAVALGAAVLLWAGVGRSVKGVLSGLVGVMGVTFLVVAVMAGPEPLAVARGSLIPSIPEGSLALVLALVGTTIVPYNLFLGSSLAIGKDPREARLGIGVAVLIGGIISAGIVLAGTVVTGELSFPNIAAALTEKLGPAARPLFGIGLFAAGFTSAVTAPLAAALTIDAVMRRDGSSRDERGARFRATWLIVLAVGVYFGLRGSKPVEVILLAQAANGALLPIVAVFLYRIVRDPRVVPPARSLSRGGDIALRIAVGVTVLLGLLGLAKALANYGLPLGDESARLPWIIAVAALLSLLLTRRSIDRGIVPE